MFGTWCNFYDFIWLKNRHWVWRIACVFYGKLCTNMNVVCVFFSLIRVFSIRKFCACRKPHFLKIILWSCESSVWVWLSIPPVIDVYVPYIVYRQPSYSVMTCLFHCRTSVSVLFLNKTVNWYGTEHGVLNDLCPGACWEHLIIVKCTEFNINISKNIECNAITDENTYKMFVHTFFK